MRRLATIIAIVLFSLSEFAAAQDLTIGDYSLVSSKRVGRTVFEYTYVATITNSAIDVQNVSATLTSNTPNTTVVDGELGFGDVTSGSTVTSIDTITIRQNRRFPFSWSNLNWNVAYDTGSLGITLDQSSAVSGLITPEGGTLSTVGSNGAVYTLTVGPDALQNDQEISITPISRLEGIPILKNLLAAVHLSPSGLQLDPPAVLTVEPVPTQAGREIPIGVLVQDNGFDIESAVTNIQGNTLSLQIPHFTVTAGGEIVFEDMVDIFATEYGELINKLILVNNCSDIEMEQALQHLARIMLYEDLLPTSVEFSPQECVVYEVSETCKTSATINIGQDFETCIEYTTQEGDPQPQPFVARQCVTPNDYAEAARDSVRNRITEIFKEKDQACKSDPGQERGALDCIAVAGNISDYALIPTASGLFDQDLFRIKECGISDIDLLPDEEFMSPGENKVFTVVITDKNGNRLTGRQIDWLLDDKDIATLIINQDTASITAEKNGVINISALDRSSFDITSFSDWTINWQAQPAGKMNWDKSRVHIGGVVRIIPDRVGLVSPNTADVEAEIFNVNGAPIPAAGFFWDTSDASIVSVESFGGANRQARLTAGDAGIATITATETGTGLRGAAEVVVGARVIVTPPEVCLRVFETEQLSALVEDITGEAFPGVDPLEIVWFTPDASTVDVSITGDVIAQSEGRVQIEATYKNSTGFSTVFVPRFPDDYTVTPVYTPPFFNWKGIQHASAYRLNDVGEVENTKREALKTAALCEITDALPARMIKNNTGLYTYVGADNFAYLFDSNTCEEFEIPISALLSPTPVAINDHGHVAGTIIGGDGERVGFVYEFGKLEGDPVTFLSAGCNTDIFDINNNGEIIGSAGACIVEAICTIEGQEEPEIYLKKTSDGSNFIYSNGSYFVIPGGIPGVPQSEGDSMLCPGGDPPPNTNCPVPVDGCTINDPVEGLEWIRPSAINDQGVLIGNYRYWDDNFGWYQTKGFIYDDQGNYRLLDPPFPLTLPVQAEWNFADINNRDDILISSRPLAREELLEDFVYSVMHLCPLQ